MIIATTKKDKILRYSPVGNKPDLNEEKCKTSLRDRHKSLKEIERHSVSG